MRKYGLYLLIAMSLMTGCQKKDIVTVDTAAETTQESGETGSTAEREPESAVESISGTDQNGNTGADARTDRFALIPIAVSGEYDGEWDDTDQTPIITSRCDKVYVQGDGYDALKQSLISLNKKLVSQNKEEYASYKKEAEDMRNNYPDRKQSYVCNYEFNPVRFDHTVVSMYWLKYYDLGGAHPSSVTEYHNFDTQTGKEMELCDVVKDLPGFRKYVEEELSDQKEEKELFEDYEMTVDSLFAGTDGYGPLGWCITKTGVCIHFDQYVIASYAAGAVEVEVPFAGNETMFQTDYIGKASEGWAKKTSPWETVTYGNGGTDTSVSYHFDDAADGYGTRNITIEREQGGKKEEFTMELYGQPQDGWIAMTDDGHPYLYTEIQSENDWRTLEVFDLKGEEIRHLGTSNDSPHGALLNDPDGFYLTRRVDALGTYDAYRKFHVGESGMPVAENDVYTKVNVCDSKEDEAALVSTRELPVTVFDADGSGKEEKLPAGTRYYVRATDLESFVDMELSDGRRCRLAVGKSDKGWGFEIDGTYEEDCFEFIPYAG